MVEALCGCGMNICKGHAHCTHKKAVFLLHFLCTKNIYQSLLFIPTNCKEYVGRFHHFTGHKGLRKSRRIALLYSIFDLGTRRWWGISVTPRPQLTPEKDPIPIVQEVGWASGPVWTGAENLAPTGIRSPDRTGRRQSLYRLSYPAHTNNMLNTCIYHQLPHTCFGVGYTIFRETIALLAQQLYAFLCNVQYAPFF